MTAATTHKPKPTLASDLQPPAWLRVTFAALERISPRGGGVLAASLFTTPRKHRTPDWGARPAGNGPPSLLRG